MFSFLKTAAGITTMWGLAGVAIWALLQFNKNQKGKATPIAWGIILGILILALTPTLSWVQLERERAEHEEQRQGRRDALNTIYQVRVTVLDPQKQPVTDAKVTSSVNAIPKRVDGGYELDIPVASRPASGKLTVYAMVENAFWTGTSDVQLGGEYNLTTTVQLKAGESALVRGMVQNDAGHAVDGARVSVIGYGAESVTTQDDGSFILSAHAADGQQVELHAEKPGYKAVSQWHPAGRNPATLILERDKSK